MNWLQQIINFEPIHEVSQTRERAEVLYTEQRARLSHRASSLFALLLGIQWLLAIGIAIILVPTSWHGAEVAPSFHVVSAVFLGGLIVIPGLVMGMWMPLRRETKVVVATSQVFIGSLLIHLLNGRIEGHFHVFGSLAFLAFYRDFRLILYATLLIAIDHIIRGFAFPESIYGTAEGATWRWLEHAAWVVFEDIFLFLGIRLSLVEMKLLAKRQAESEWIQSQIEQTVELRTKELTQRTDELISMQAHSTELQHLANLRAEVASIVNQELPLEEQLTAVAERLKTYLDAALVQVWKLPEGSETLELRASVGIDTPRDGETTRIPMGAFTIGRIAMARIAHISNSVMTDSQTENPDWAKREGLVAFAGHPLLVGNQLVGVLGLFARHPLTTDVLEAIRVSADSLAIGIVRCRTEAKLRDNVNRLRLLGTAIESSPNAIYITNRAGIIQWVNPAFTELTGYTPAEAIGNTPRILKSGEVTQEQYEKLWATILSGKTWSGEMIELNKGGERFIVKQTVTPLLNERGEITEFVAVQENVTARRIAEGRLRDMAVTDPLTGLYNRNGLRERLIEILQTEHPALLFIDLDRFKVINDALGHQQGDELLKQVATRLLRRTRTSDVVARLGGDEFLVIQTGVRSHSDAESLARGLVELMRKPFLLKGEEFKLSASIGIVMTREGNTNADELIRDADMAMYRAKQEGKGTYRFFSPSLEAKVMERITIENEIRKGLEADEFELHYQPQIDARSGEICGAEALIRWRHPRRGLVPPGLFLPVAEESGLILPISEWVIREACREGKRRLRDGKPLRIAINISVAQVRHGDLVHSVTEALWATGLPPELLELEITEGLLMPDIPEAKGLLERLHELGVTLAIDDFGTGYSSLSYLSRLPVHVLKIDRSFVSRVPGEAKDIALIRAIAGLGHDLGLKLVAEGVETAEQVEFLRQVDCDLLQGYYFSKPVPADLFPESAEELVRR